jgi:hypothetical protein
LFLKGEVGSFFLLPSLASLDVEAMMEDIAATARPTKSQLRIVTPRGLTIALVSPVVRIYQALFLAVCGFAMLN